MLIIQIRPTTPADYRITEEITREAFWNLHAPGCNEHYLLHQMRTGKDFVRPGHSGGDHFRISPGLR